MFPKSVLVVLLVTAGIGHAMTTTLDFGSLPSSQGWTPVIAPAFSEADIWSLSGGVLTLDTMGLGFLSGSPGASYQLPGVVTMEPFVLSFRARCLQEEIIHVTTAQTFFFAVAVNNQVYNVVVGPDQIALAADGASYPHYYSLDGTQFHDYVLEGTPGIAGYTVTVDGTLVFAGEAAYSSSHLVGFGDGSGGGNVLAEITALTFEQPPVVIPVPGAMTLAVLGILGVLPKRRSRADKTAT